MKTFVMVSEGVIKRVMTGADNFRPVMGMQEVPSHFEGKVGDRVEWYDDNWHRISDADLLRRGIIKDYRGRWYRITDHTQHVDIETLGEHAPAGYTKVAPPESPNGNIRFNIGQGIWEPDPNHGKPDCCAHTDDPEHTGAHTD